jgi:hypothetical protein
MTEIHPVFKKIPDTDIAEVFSETLVPGGYKIIHQHDITFTGEPKFTSIEDFPPEPSYLTSMTAAYIDKDKSIRRVSIHGLSGDEIQPNDKKVIEAYNNSVCELQELVESLESLTPFMNLPATHPKFGKLGQWAIDTTRKDGKRLIAAHLIFVNPDNNRIHHGMSIPTVIKESFPLIVRDAIEPIILRRDQFDLTSEEIIKLESKNDIFSAIMGNKANINFVSGIPPSAVMPPKQNFESALKAYRNFL